VRSGGQSRAGFGTSEGGIVLDLSEMNAVEIDAEGRTAWAQTGITAGDYTKATGKHGLATGLGDTASVGVGGITLGGGIGFLVRKHGLTIDDVLGAEVVTADGELLKVDEDTHPDLFWALRGGGGNFGVATRLRFRLHEIDEVIGGMLMLPASAEVIVGLVAAAEAAPEELSVIANVTKAPPLPFVPAEQHGKPVVMARMVYAGMPRPVSGRSRPSARSRRRSPTWSGRSATRRFTRRARGRRSTGGRTCSSMAWPPGRAVQMPAASAFRLQTAGPPSIFVGPDAASRFWCPRARRGSTMSQDRGWRGAYWRQARRLATCTVQRRIRARSGPHDNHRRQPPTSGTWHG
jgi:hypothetical protein